MMSFKAKILQFKIDSIRNSFNDKLNDNGSDVKELKKSAVSSLNEVIKQVGELTHKDRIIVGESLNSVVKWIESK